MLQTDPFQCNSTTLLLGRHFSPKPLKCTCFTLGQTCMTFVGLMELSTQSHSPLICIWTSLFSWCLPYIEGLGKRAVKVVLGRFMQICGLQGVKSNSNLLFSNDLWGLSCNSWYLGVSSFLSFQSKGPLSPLSPYGTIHPSLENTIKQADTRQFLSFQMSLTNTLNV